MMEIKKKLKTIGKKNLIIIGIISIVLFGIIFVNMPQGKVIINNFSENMIIGNILQSIGIGDEKIKSGSLGADSFKRRTITQTKVDPIFPCHIKDSTTIVCSAINQTEKDKYCDSDSLSLSNQDSCDTEGVPVTNLIGDSISEKYIELDKTTEIKVDLTNPGTFHIGFNSNEFIITDLSVGIFNLTTPSGGDVYLQTNELTGEYYSEILDMNSTMSVSNISFESFQPPGSEITMSIRTHNLTNGEITGLFEGLQAYWKFDSYPINDYSGKNNSDDSWTGTPSLSVSDCKYDGCSDFSTQLINLPDADGLHGGAGLTVMAWINPDSLSSWDGIVTKDTGSQMSYWFGTSGSALGCILSANGATSTTRYDGVLTIGNWHQVACVYDGSTIELFIDGVSTGGTTAFTGPVFDGNSVMEIGNSNKWSGNQYDGQLDEVMIWNRSLSSAEISNLYNNELVDWSSWSPEYTASPSSITVDDGRYVQVKSTLSRVGGENVYLEEFNVSYTTSGTAPPVDNPPVTTLITTDQKTFTTSIVELNASATDDINLTNMTMYTNRTGSWAVNITINVTGISSGEKNFTINISDGTYLWNVLTCDNSSQCAWNSNRTFSVSTACVNSTCYPYICNPTTNDCYDECNAHSHCNSSSYCNVGAECTASLSDLSDCKDKQWDALTDDEICTSQDAGYCYDDINVFGYNGEFCTSTFDNCVHDGVEYSDSEIKCEIFENDYFQCGQGGSGIWGSLVDCGDSGDPYDDSAKSVLSHTYCGYYDAQSCDGGIGGAGCTPALNTLTQDCGNYYYDDTIGTCGTGTTSCDVNCGATYDLETCPSPNTLSADCTTCTVPVEDNKPTVTLSIPSNSSTQTTESIIFQYDVSDEFGLHNCSLWFLTDTISWHKNQTNSSAISRIATNSFIAVPFNDEDNITWNVECYDNASQVDLADTNFTFSVDTTFIEKKRLDIRVDNMSNDVVWSVNEDGDVNVTGDIYIWGDFYLHGSPFGLSPFTIPELLVTTFLDIATDDNTGVRMTTPYDEYLKIAGKVSGKGLLIAVFGNDAHISSDPGDTVIINDNLEVRGDIVLTDNSTISRDGVNTTTWIGDSGNLITKFGGLLPLL